MADRAQLTAVIWREDGDEAFSALCPELDVASMGDTEEEALAMLQEAVEGYLELVPDAMDHIREHTVAPLVVRNAA